MKNINLAKFFILLLVTSVSLVSCSSEDDGEDGNGNGNGNANYDGTEFTFNQGYVINYGVSDGNANLYNFDITLLSDGFNIDLVNEEVEGTGEVLYFELWTENSTGLKSGTYKLSNGEDDFGMTYADFVMDYSFDEESTDESFLEATSAEITINKSGSTYTLAYDLTFDNGKSMTGTYVGSLMVIED